MIWWIGTLLAFIGNGLIIYKRRTGWLCWIVANIILGIQSAHIHAWNLVAQFAIFEILAIIGWIRWKREG